MAPSLFNRKKAKGLIAVLMRDLDNPFYIPFMTTIEQIADAMGYCVVFSRKTTVERKNIDCMDMMAEQADGVIFLGESTVKLFEIELLLAMGKPFIIFQGNKQVEGASYMTVDNEKASFDAMTHLYRCGHRRVVHITAPMYHHESSQRARGYEKAVKEYALEYQHKIHIDMDYESIFDMGCRLGEMVRNERLTAAYCFNDLIATGIIDGLTDQGIRVPEHFSVIGFDDISFRDRARNWIPVISSVQQPREEMAAYAVEKVVDMMENGLFDASKTFQCQFVDRDSVRMI